MNPVTILSYTIASRTMITISRGEDWISLVADPDSDQSRAGLQGCYGRLSVLRKLTQDAIDQWRLYPHTVEDEEVSL